MLRIKLLAAAAAIIFLGSPALAQNVVVNPGFENAGLTSWTTDGSWGTAITGVITGSFSARTGCTGSVCIRNFDGSLNLANGAFLYQDVATTPGSFYNLSFDFAAAGFPNELVALFGSTVAFDGVNLPSTNLTYNSTGLLATGTTTRLTFLGRQDPGFNRLDNVSLVASGQVAAVPEPATWAMMLMGFGAMGVSLRRKRRPHTLLQTA